MKKKRKRQKRLALAAVSHANNDDINDTHATDSAGTGHGVSVHAVRTFQSQRKEGIVGAALDTRRGATHDDDEDQRRVAGDSDDDWYGRDDDEDVEDAGGRTAVSLSLQGPVRYVGVEKRCKRAGVPSNYGGTR